MSGARLISIKFDPKTFVFAGISQGFDPDFSIMELGEPYPVVKNMPDGDYSIQCFFSGHPQNPFLGMWLVDDIGAKIDEMYIPVNPRFATMTTAMDILSAEIEAGKTPGPDASLSDALNWLVESKPQDDATNEVLRTQSDIFKEELSRWIEVEGQQSLISNLFITIEGNSGPLFSLIRSNLDIDPLERK